MGKKIHDHIHIYERVTEKQFRCVKEGCTHIISAMLILGRTACCPYCENTFTIDREHLRRKKLHCLKCRRDPLESVEEQSPELSPFSSLLKEKGIS